MADVRQILAGRYQRRRIGAGRAAVPMGRHARASTSSGWKRLRREGNSSVYITGVDPGFATDLMPVRASPAPASASSRSAPWRSPTTPPTTARGDVRRDGLRQPIGDLPMLFLPGVLSIAWGTAIRQLAAGLGVEVDEITGIFEQEPAPEDIDVAVGTHRQGDGGGAALRDQRHGQGQARHRRRARHPAARATCARTGRSRPSPAAPTGSRSPASRRTSWTSAHQRERWCATTRRSWPRPAGS